MESRLLAAVCTVVLTLVTVAANAGLIGRLETFPGSGVFKAFYDDQLNITWLADVNAAAGSAFDDGFSSTDGRMTWNNATEWVASLDISGVTGWRLPNMDVNGDDNIVDCRTVTQAACTDNEYGHLFYYGAGTTLGGGVNSTRAPFGIIPNIAPYWSSTESTSDPASAWIFSFGDGFMGTAVKSYENFAWAVRSGDVGPPSPPSTFIVTVDEPDFKFNATADPTGVIGAIYDNGREWDLEGYNHSAFIFGSPVIPIDESQIRLSAVDWSASPDWNWALTLRAHHNGTPFSLVLYSLDPPVQSVLDTGIFPSLSLLNELEWRLLSAKSHGILVEPRTTDFKNGRLVYVQFDPAPLYETLIDINGTIKTVEGSDICAIVLASGQFMFSCNPPGVFSLTDLPRESNGTVKRQIYADGFFPKIDSLMGFSSEAVVMTRSGTCPNYNSPYDQGFFPDSAGKRIDISGLVLLQDTQMPICAMVLANGQHMFSCNGTGSYALNIPLDTNGQFKLQVYADGFAPTIQTFDEFHAINDVRMARATECQ